MKEKLVYKSDSGHAICKPKRNSRIALKDQGDTIDLRFVKLHDKKLKKKDVGAYSYQVKKRVIVAGMTLSKESAKYLFIMLGDMLDIVPLKEEPES